MVMKSMALAVICLLLGGVAGYRLRSVEKTGAASSSGSDRVTTKAPSPAAVADSAMAKGTAPAAPVSLRDRMKALLANYDSAAARKAVAGLSASDIQAALALLVVVPKSADRDALRALLYRAWAKTNPTAAWKAALADPLESDDGYLLGAVAGEMAKTKPEAAVKLVLSLGMGSRRAGIFRELFNQWGKSDPAGAVAYWNKHPDLPLPYRAFTSAITRNSEKDPLRSANLVLTLTDPQTRSSAVSELMARWAAREPKTALSWAQTIGNPALKQSAIAAVLIGWSIKDPAAAISQAQAIEDRASRSSTMESVWFHWLEKDPNAAMAYLGSCNDEKLMERVGSNFAYNTEGFAQREKASLVEKLPEGKPKQDIIRSLAQAQIRSGHYNQAMELLNNMPDSTDRDYTVQQLGRQWAEFDPKAAAAWLKLQPDSSDRDLAVAGYATVLARTNPQSAVEWAGTIPDEAVRSGLLKDIAFLWLKADSAAAEAWLRGVSELSDSDKDALRKTAQTAGGERASTSVNVSDRR